MMIEKEYRQINDIHKKIEEATDYINRLQKGERTLFVVDFCDELIEFFEMQKMKYEKEFAKYVCAPTAHWKYADDGALICDSCLHECPTDPDGDYLDISYCPYCGFKMD